MDTEILIPENLWEGDDQCVITNWLAADDGIVQKGAPLVEIMVEKAQFEIAAPSTGTLSIEADVDDIVSKGDMIGMIT
jgi:pyruvate/2-oxoglutarate dehydrogenase complex dihydrolipoamide acyltransferase (E2) component